MAIYDNFPYTNIHEMNLRWIIEQVKQGNLTIEDFAEQLAQFNEDYATLSALAAAFTIAGSNISTTKNFSAASLSGPLTGNVTGNVTGNLTGNVTGNVTGNADTATYATSAGSATTATNATNATYATTAGSATNATNATNASHATTADSATTATTATSASSAITAIHINMNTAGVSVDADDYVPVDNGAVLYQTPALTTHVPSGLESERCIILTILTSIGAVQMLWAPPATTSVHMRVRVGASWQSWTTL